MFIHTITAGVTKSEAKETFTKGGFTGQKELISYPLVTLSIASVTSLLFLSFKSALILSALTIAGLALAYALQFKRKVIITILVTVTFIYTLSSILNPVWRIGATALFISICSCDY